MKLCVLSLYVCCRSKPGLQWDTTALDKVLHIFTPVILLKFGLILLFVMRPLREPYKSIECFTPKEFVSMWTKYTEKICLGKSHVYIQETEKLDTTNSTHPPGGLLPGYSNVFNQVRDFFATDFVGINIMLSYHRLPVAHRHRCSFSLDVVIFTQLWIDRSMAESVSSRPQE